METPDEFFAEVDRLLGQPGYPLQIALEENAQLKAALAKVTLERDLLREAWRTTCANYATLEKALAT